MRKGQKDVNITCLGYGYPNAKATWKRDNSEIPETSNSSIGSGIYQIRSTNDTVLDNVTSTLYFNQSGTTFEDYGLYTCEVSINPEPDTDSNTIKVICKCCLFCNYIYIYVYIQLVWLRNPKLSKKS